MADRTKIWIANAMKKLLQKKSVTDIRVTEICKEAQIERPTFYYHFKDKYDLMAWIFFQDACNMDILSVKSAAEYLEHMRKNISFYKRTYEDNSQNPMWEYMFQYFRDRYIEIAREKLHTNELDLQTRYSISHFVCGCISMNREWLLTNNQTPSETVIEMMFNSMPESLRKIYFTN